MSRDEEDRTDGPIAHLPTPVQWAVLIALTAFLYLPLGMAHLPAAALVAAIAAGIGVRTAGSAVVVSPRLRTGSEAMLGVLLARSITATAVGTFWEHAVLFIGIGLVVLAASAALSSLLLRMRLFPGSTAVWGLSPGAANVMMIMGGAFGADERLVAFMQYLRIVMVAATAPVVAHVWGDHSGGTALAPGGEVDWLAVAGSLAIAGAGVALAFRFPFPGATLLLPLALGGAAQLSGLIAIELPDWLMLPFYVALGWSVGLAFTLPVLRHAVSTLPQICAAMAVLLGFCAALGVLLSFVEGVDPLTAYLATSPGGLSSIAVIAATSRVDLPFVISMQTVRFLMVLSLGPAISRWLARKAH